VQLLSSLSPSKQGFPVRSLNRARDLVRAAGTLSGSRTVSIAAGDYTSSVVGESPLSLDPTLDSGTPSSPITWTASNSSVRFTPGIFLDPTSFEPSAPGSDILVASVAQWKRHIGDFQAGGLGTCSSALLSEVHVNGREQSIVNLCGRGGCSPFAPAFSLSHTYLQGL